MKILKHTKTWTIIFYCWLMLIVAMTSLTFSPGIEKQNDSGFRLDYIEHFIVYAIIPVLYFFARGAYLEKIIKDRYYLILLGVLFSALTEIHQYYIPGRSFNPVDLVLNLSGFTSGIFFGRYLDKILFKKK